MDNILDKIKSGEIEYEEADEGIVTSTYITDDYVVQEPDHGGGGRLEKNVFICKYLHENGVPVPEVIEYSEDPLYVVFERLEGISLDQREQFTKEEYLEAVRNAGEALSMIHDQEGSGYGKPNRDKDFESADHEDWIDFVKDYVQGSLDYVESDRFRPIVKQASEIVNLEDIPENPESRVLHMDYTHDNIMVDKDQSVKIIDFDGVYYGDPRFELMYADLILSKRDEEVTEAFMEGYHQSKDLDLTPEMEKSYKALAVLRDARGGEWCLKNDKDVDFEDWSQGLQNVVDHLEV